jgi:hypothetical protein
MIQFYALSVVLNIVGGYALLSAGIKDRGDPFDGLRAFARGEVFRLLVGFFSGVVALFKLLTAVEGDIPVIGDLFPSLTGLLCGTSLLLEYYFSKSSVTSKGLDRLKGFFLGRRKIIGILGIVAGIGHFIFPRVLFL